MSRRFVVYRDLTYGAVLRHRQVEILKIYMLLLAVGQSLVYLPIIIDIK